MQTKDPRDGKPSRGPFGITNPSYEWRGAYLRPSAPVEDRKCASEARPTAFAWGCKVPPRRVEVATKQLANAKAQSELFEFHNRGHCPCAWTASLCCSVRRC